MAHLTRPIKPRSHDRSNAGISHERLARRRYAPCPRFWRLLFDPWSFPDTRRLANPEVSDGDATLGWPWDTADRVFGPYGIETLKPWYRLEPRNGAPCLKSRSLCPHTEFRVRPSTVPHGTPTIRNPEPILRQTRWLWLASIDGATDLR